MTKTKKYFIKLTPAGYYFFGGENTFNTNRKDKYNQEVTNYFAISQKLPQQTALLGLLRHTLLTLYGRLDHSWEEKKPLIGAKGFGLDRLDAGLIKAISPICLVNQIDKQKPYAFYVPAGYDEQAYSKETLKYSRSKEPAYINAITPETPEITGLDYKEDISLLWSKHDKPEVRILEKKIFKEVIKVGVDRHEVEDAFYKQKLYGLHKNWSFGLWVALDEDIDKEKLKTTFMPFGADQGVFKIEFRYDIGSIFEPKDEGSLKNKLTLLSDTWVEKSLWDKVDFGISGWKSFRFINSKKEKHYRQVDKSAKYRLLKRGTILYSTDMAVVEDEINKHKAMKEIGYNYYKIN